MPDKGNDAQYYRNDLLDLLTFLGTLTNEKELFVDARKYVWASPVSIRINTYVEGIRRIFFPGNYFVQNNLFIEASQYV